MTRTVAQSVELLEATHNFPCAFMVKIIGKAEQGFVERVVAVVQSECDDHRMSAVRTRKTPGGRHVAVTMEPVVESAEQVLALYERIRRIEGVVLLM